MNLSRLGILVIASAFAIVSACGGGGGGLAVLSPSLPIGGGSSGGIGGSGFTTSGTIDGTGSIFVNGVRFDVSGADIRIDGESASEEDLGPGMVVTVRGSLDDDDPGRGIAEEVDYERELVGPIDSIELSSDGNSMRLRILNRSVIAERVNTVFSDLGFSTIALGQVVEISGFVDAQNRIRATRIALNPDFVAGQSEIKLQGTVSQLEGNEFRAGDRIVQAGNATLVNLPGGTLANGQQVEVTGTLTGNIITASQITLVGSLTDNLQSGDQLRVQGAITNFVNRSNFRVRDIPVSAASADLQLSGDSLREGLIVEIEGPWNGSVLDATSVKTRRGRIRAEARLSGIDAEARTLTLQFATGSITLTSDDRTLFTDDDEDFLSFGALRTGAFVSAEAVLNGNTLLATRVRREDDDDDQILQGPVERFVSGVSVTILGVTFDTAGADFETVDDEEVDSDIFYASISIGDLVRVEDEEPANGIADEVTFESALNLDGDIEFPEDDSDDDSQDVDDDSGEEDDEAESPEADDDPDVNDDDDEADSPEADDDLDPADDAESPGDDDEDDEEDDDDDDVTVDE